MKTGLPVGDAPIVVDGGAGRTGGGGNPKGTGRDGTGRGSGCSDDETPEVLEDFSGADGPDRSPTGSVPS